MKSITAYKSDAGTVYEHKEDAEAADLNHDFRLRIAEFIKQSPLTYDGAREMEGWLRTTEGREAVMWLAGMKA